MKLIKLTSALSLVGRQRLSMVAISCRRAYHVCSTTATARAGDMLKTAATRRGHRLLLLLRQDDHQLTTHCYTVALHAVRRYSGASDGGRHDGPITVAAHERVTVPPPPITLPVLDGTVIDALFDDLLLQAFKVLQLIDEVVVDDDHVFLHVWVVLSAFVDLDKVELILVSEG